MKFSNYFADTPSGPIKTTTTTDTLRVANNFSEISNTPPTEDHDSIAKKTILAMLHSLDFTVMFQARQAHSGLFGLRDKDCTFKV